MYTIAYPLFIAALAENPDALKLANDLDPAAGEYMRSALETAQKLILKGYMHSVFRDMREIPRGSVSTDELIEKDMGVNWEAVYHGREDISLLWTDIVANR